MENYQTSTFIHLVITVVLLKHINCLCVFGNQDNCLLKCNCQNDGNCDVNTGKCDVDICKQDVLLSRNNPDGQQYWSGPACQTGNIATGKYANQVGTYYNPGFKINATADKAIDGNISTYAYSRLHGSTPAWWVLHLEDLYVIQKAFLLANNLGNSLILLENYTLWVGNSSAVFNHELCGRFPSPLLKTYSYSTGLNWNTLQCEKYLVGRYVSIRKTADDRNRNWLPIHEVAIIGYPVSSVHLGRCNRHATNGYTNLLNLTCEQCVDGWLEPDCRLESKTIITSNQATTSSDSQVDNQPSTTYHYKYTTGDNQPSTYHDNVDTTSMPAEIPDNELKTLPTVIIIVIVSLAVFTVVSVVVIVVLCIKLRKRRKQSGQNTTNATTFSKGQGRVENLHFNGNNTGSYMGLNKSYEPLNREKVYLGLTTDPVQMRDGYVSPIRMGSSIQSDGYEVPVSTFKDTSGKNILVSTPEGYDDAESAPVYSTIDDVTYKN